MSWTNELYNVYEQNCGRDDLSPKLLPLSHSTANAQVQLTITENGEFVTARKVEKEEAETIIPVTEASAARSSGVCSHPFADKLIYIAGDYSKYIDGKKSDNSKHFECYITQLKIWAESEFSHPAVKAVYKYLEKSCLINDLISSKVLVADEDTGILKDKIKIAGIAQEDSFVRFCVQYDNDLKEIYTWKDTTLYDSFINYNNYVFSKENSLQLCYATGEMLAPTYKHPSKIRNSGDKAKLISSNDESGFSYRGRFDNKEQAISVSYEFSQKMHSALKWLISRQGIYIENSLVLVVWESCMRQLPDITKPAYDDYYEEGDDISQEFEYPVTFANYKEVLQKNIFGQTFLLNDYENTVVMGFDAATTGRLSISLYSELPVSEFLSNVEKWHEDTAWVRFNSKKRCNIINSFSLKEIINYAFGNEQDKFIKCKPEVMKDYICRLVPCVTEAKNIPEDIVRALINKASNPLKYNNEYNWRKVLEAACGMIRKQKIENKEECSMSLDKNCTNRSYLYGRLLAIADVAEASTYSKEEERTTNAKRYFETFANRPCTTWDVISKRLEPYLQKMPTGSEIYYRKLINEVVDMFDREVFCDNSKLEPEYLHAYSCQVRELYKSKEEKAEDKNNN